MCRAGGPRCPKESRRLLNKARDAYSATPTKATRAEYHHRLYQYQLTRTGLDELRTELDRLKAMKDARGIKALSERIDRLEWDRAKMTQTRQAEQLCQQYVTAMSERFPQAPEVFERLEWEGRAFQTYPKKSDVERWLESHNMNEDAVPFNPSQFYALKNLYRRCNYLDLINSTETVDMEPPGSQAEHYPRDDSGRISEVYYASYGSNMRQDRFHAYIQGGTVKGSSRVYGGCKDNTLPKDDIPVRFEHPIFYAMRSSVWHGGVAFLDYSETGDSLGRAYLISSGQFDDVISQESGYQAKGHHVDLDGAVANRVVQDSRRVYGTLVHVGDYNNRPVMTFTSRFNTEDAMYGDMRFPSRTGKGVGSRFMGNSPSGSYMRMIGQGLEETFGFDKHQQATYFLGSFGGNYLGRTSVRNSLDYVPPPKTETKSNEKSKDKVTGKSKSSAKGKATQLPLFSHSYDYNAKTNLSPDPRVSLWVDHPKDK